MKIFLIALFYLIYALISFAIIYSGDTADIADTDFEDYSPSISDLSEEERTDYCTLDSYIKTTICPRYHYQILKNEINYYQKDNIGFLYIFFANACLCIVPLKILGIETWLILYYFVTLIIGFICSFVVWLLYTKYSPYRIKDYYEIHSSYNWESHYKYLLRIKENVIFRHILRKFLGYLLLLIAFIIGVWMYE